MLIDRKSYAIKGNANSRVWTKRHVKNWSVRPRLIWVDQRSAISWNLRSHDRRRNEVVRTIETLHQLTAALNREVFELKRSSVYFHLLPWNHRAKQMCQACSIIWIHSFSKYDEYVLVIVGTKAESGNHVTFGNRNISDSLWNVQIQNVARVFNHHTWKLFLKDFYHHLNQLLTRVMELTGQKITKMLPTYSCIRIFPCKMP